MVEFALIGVVGTSVLLNVVDHSAGLITSIEHWWRRYNRRTTRIMKHNNVIVYNLITELIDPYCTRLSHREMVTQELKWNGVDDKNKVMFIMELDACITISVKEQKRNNPRNITLYRCNENTLEGYDIYGEHNEIINAFLLPIYERLRMDEENIKRLMQ